MYHKIKRSTSLNRLKSEGLPACTFHCTHRVLLFACDVFVEPHCNRVRPGFETWPILSVAPHVLFVVRQLLELYGLMKSVALVIESCQGVSAPSAPGGVIRVVKLLHELREDVPQRLHDPSHFFQLPAEQGAGVEEEDATNETTARKATRTIKAHEELTEVAQSTRIKLRKAILDRFAGVRYSSEKYKAASHLFDMVCAINPFMRSLPHIGALCPTAGVAAAVKGRVWQELEKLATRVVKALRESGEDVGPRHPPAKKLKFTPPEDSDDESFLFDDTAGHEEEKGEGAERSPETLAREAMDEYKSFQVMNILLQVDFCSVRPLHNLLRVAPNIPVFCQHAFCHTPEYFVSRMPGGFHLYGFHVLPLPEHQFNLPMWSLWLFLSLLSVA